MCVSFESLDTIFIISMCMQVFPVLWNLVCLDVFATWKIAPLFQKHSEPHILIAEPLEVRIYCVYMTM